MRLNDIGEFGFIERIRQGLLIRRENVIKGIGDDAAVFRMEREKVIVSTTDMLVEGIHFIRERMSGFDLGYKAMAVNLSDIAAMGAVPREAFVSLAVPKDCDIAYLDDVYAGMKELARTFEVNILGGDTTGSRHDLIININLLGEAAENEVMYRGSAAPGDVIFVTGFLGDSAAGLYMIQNNIEDEAFKSLKNAHFRPRPYIEEGRFLAGYRGVHAAIDVSDGLSADIGHIVRESRAGVRLIYEKLPISSELESFCITYNVDPEKFILAGGEDYVLIVTVSPDVAEMAAIDYLKTFQRPLYRIGTVVDSNDATILYVNGIEKELTNRGWDHFKPEEETDS